MFSLKILILNVLLLFSYAESVSDLYQLAGKNKKLDSKSYQPVFIRNVTSLTECLMKTRQLSDNVCFVQTEFVAKGVWQCSLYKKIERASFKTVPHKNSHVYISSGEQCQSHADTSLKQRDCSEWYRKGETTDGVYTIEIDGIVEDVYCDMTRDAGGWTVIQKRFDGTVAFNRTWEEYKNGFGDPSGEYWLGNEMVHRLTGDTTATTEMRMTGTRFSGEQKHIIASGFSIEDETEKYKLHTGTKVYGDQPLFSNWKHHDRGFFSTKDSDNDSHKNADCSQNTGDGGWWFKSCQRVNPNGPYSKDEHLSQHRKGLMWYAWLDQNSSLKSFEIAIRIKS